MSNEEGFHVITLDDMLARAQTEDVLCRALGVPRKGQEMQEGQSPDPLAELARLIGSGTLDSYGPMSERDMRALAKTYVEPKPSLDTETLAVYLAVFSLKPDPVRHAFFDRWFFGVDLDEYYE